MKTNETKILAPDEIMVIGYITYTDLTWFAYEITIIYPKNNNKKSV